MSTKEGAATKRARRPLVRRHLADMDVARALDRYLEESPRAASGFVRALERAYSHIRRAPDTGSPRTGQEVNLPGLRSWPCHRYPYIVFYMPLEDRIEVWRVLPSQADIPSWLRPDLPVAGSAG